MGSARARWGWGTPILAAAFSAVAFFHDPRPVAGCGTMCVAHGELPGAWSDGTVAQLDDSTSWRLDSSGITRSGPGVRQSYEPTEEDLNGLFFVSPSRGWVVGATGTILHTSDGGRHWKAQTAPADGALMNVTCVDAMHCWALGEDGGVVATSDGGRRWASVGRLPGVGGDDHDDVRHLFFASRTTGWVTTAHGRLLSTRDGGATWTASTVRLSEDDEDAAPLGLLRFFDERVGWIASGRRVARTEDGGATWQTTLDVGSEFAIAALAARSATEVYVAVASDCLARNSPSLTQLVDLTDRLSGRMGSSGADDAVLRRAGAAEIPRLLAGAYDAFLADASAVRASLARYPGSRPLGRSTTVTWQAADGLGPIATIPPEYPAIAQQARVQGVVILDLSIEATAGRVESVRVLRGIPLLDSAAIAAVKQWRFATGAAGPPVRVTFLFELLSCVPGGTSE